VRLCVFTDRVESLRLNIIRIQYKRRQRQHCKNGLDQTRSRRQSDAADDVHDRKFFKSRHSSIIIIIIIIIITILNTYN